MGLVDDLLGPDSGGSGIGDVLGRALGAVGSGLSDFLEALLGALFSPGGAAVVAGGGAAYLGYRWWRYGLLGLFTRIAPRRALDQPTRAKVFDHVQQHPGARAHDIVKALGLANGQVTHHLRILEAQQLVVRTRGAFARRYFVRGILSPAQMAKAIAQSHPAFAPLEERIRGRPGSTIGELADALGVSVTRVSRLAERMRDAGLVRAQREGRNVRLYPAA